MSVFKKERTVKSELFSGFRKFLASELYGKLGENHVAGIHEAFTDTDLTVMFETRNTAVPDFSFSDAFRFPAFPVREILNRAGCRNDFENGARSKCFGNGFIEVCAFEAAIRFDILRDMVRIERGRADAAEYFSGSVIVDEDRSAAVSEQFVSALAGRR